MTKRKKLAIISTHPIQYNAPLFRLLEERNNVQIKVFYTWGLSVLQNKYDPGFGKIVEWDIPLLEGYDYEFVENIAEKKGSDHFNGIDNPMLNSSIEKFGADAVLIYGWAHVSHLKAMRYFKRKIPVLFRGDSTLLDDKNRLKALLRCVILKWVYRHIDYALYAGKSNYNYFINAGVKNNQLFFAPHAVENKRFAKKENSFPSFREYLKIGETDFVFLFAGKLENKKAVQILIEAFINAGFNEKTHLVITGNGILEMKLKTIASGKNNIHFLDFQNQKKMPAVYQTCDVFILPSQGPGETWGLAVNEAMAAGKPAIVSNKCGCAEDLIINGETGFIFESGDVDELSKYLKWCCSNNVKVKKMGDAAVARISNYSFEKIAFAIENIVSEQQNIDN